MRLFIPEAEIEAMVISYIDEIKRHYIIWANPFDLARELGISIAFGKIGPDQEGAAFAEQIVINPSSMTKARESFTIYHEIVHHLVKRNDALYSILHDQYCSDEDLTNIIEHLCNVGAAEFLIPRRAVLDAIEARGFSLLHVRDLSRPDKVSPTAVCVQLVQCAKHSCIATVCRMVWPQKRDNQELFDDVEQKMALQVETAISSSYTKYRIARESLIPKGHLLYEAYKVVGDDIVSGIDSVPFRSNRTWQVKCEAMHIGKQVFALFHLESPPIHAHCQLPLF